MQVERRESGQADSESAMEMEYGRSEDEELEVKWIIYVVTSIRTAV